MEKIGEKAFNDCTRLQEVSFPSSMREVGKDAFFECISLKTVRLNDGLLKFGTGSFFQCRCLKEITIPKTVTSLGDYMLAWCDQLERVVINAPVTEIPREFLDSAFSVKSVNIPSTVKKIGDRAFYNLNQVKSFRLPDELDEIGAEAFNGCDGITINTINAKVIGKKAFYGTNLDSIPLGKAVEEIRATAFETCGEKEKGSVMTIPASVKNIEDGGLYTAFIKSYKVASGNTEYKTVDGVLFSKDGKRLISFPNFKEVKDYTIPDGVEEIVDYAFSTAKITGRVTVPASVKK